MQEGGGVGVGVRLLKILHDIIILFFSQVIINYFFLSNFASTVQAPLCLCDFHMDPKCLINFFKFLILYGIGLLITVYTQKSNLLLVFKIYIDHSIMIFFIVFCFAVIDVTVHSIIS